MSRSVKNRHLKNGAHFHWVSFFSNKRDKQIANRAMRRINRVHLKNGDEDLIHSLKEVRDIWNFDSDGECGYINFLSYRFYNHLNRYSPWTRDDIRSINAK